jgi:glycosyltransferase involved in cell wall biosynthesis
LGKEWQVPVLLSIRDLWPDVFYTLLPEPLQCFGPLVFAPWQIRARRACRLATSIVGISPGYLNWGLSRAGRTRGVNDALIPLGYPARRPVDLDSTVKAQASLQARGVDFSRPLISFCGSFGRSYDLATVISAAKILAHQSDAQFVLCGDGERAAAWKAEAKDLPNVVFTGWVDQVEIATLLDASTLGLAAYAKGVKQGLPNKFFEYMSFGLPVVSALRGEAAVEIKTYGFGCNYQSGNGADLAQALTTVLGDPPSLMEMGKAAQNRFDSTYHQSLIYQHYIDLVERLANKTPTENTVSGTQSAPGYTGN